MDMNSTCSFFSDMMAMHGMGGMMQVSIQPFNATLRLLMTLVIPSQMYFHFGSCEQLLFESWKIDTAGGACTHNARTHLSPVECVLVVVDRIC